MDVRLLQNQGQYSDAYQLTNFRKLLQRVAKSVSSILVLPLEPLCHFNKVIQQEKQGPLPHGAIKVVSCVQFNY